MIVEPRSNGLSRGEDSSDKVKDVIFTTGAQLKGTVFEVNGPSEFASLRFKFNLMNLNSTFDFSIWSDGVEYRFLVIRTEDAGTSDILVTIPLQKGGLSFGINLYSNNYTISNKTKDTYGYDGLGGSHNGLVYPTAEKTSEISVTYGSGVSLIPHTFPSKRSLKLVVNDYDLSGGSYNFYVAVKLL